MSQHINREQLQNKIENIINSELKEYKTKLDDEHYKKMNKLIHKEIKLEGLKINLDIQQDEIKKYKQLALSHQDFIDLHIGGKTFPVSKMTLLKIANTYFTTLLAERVRLKTGAKYHHIDRDNTHFPLILNYLRDYGTYRPGLINKLIKMNYEDIIDLLKETYFYGFKKLSKIVYRCSNRFDPLTCNSIRLNLSENLTKITKQKYNDHQSCAVQGILDVGKRYIELIVLNSSSRCIKLGISKILKQNRYPGDSLIGGLSWNGSDGYIYMNDRTYNKDLPTFGTNDRIGMLVDMDQRTIQYYKNQEKVGPEISFSFMEIKDLYIIINLFTVNDSVKIVYDTEFMDIE